MASTPHSEYIENFVLKRKPPSLESRCVVDHTAAAFTDRVLSNFTWPKTQSVHNIQQLILGSLCDDLAGPSTVLTQEKPCPWTIFDLRNLEVNRARDMLQSRHEEKVVQYESFQTQINFREAFPDSCSEDDKRTTRTTGQEGTGPSAPTARTSFLRLQELLDRRRGSIETGSSSSQSANVHREQDICSEHSSQTSQLGYNSDSSDESPEVSNEDQSRGGTDMIPKKTAFASPRNHGRKRLAQPLARWQSSNEKFSLNMHDFVDKTRAGAPGGRSSSVPSSSRPTMAELGTQLLPAASASSSSSPCGYLVHHPDCTEHEDPSDVFHSANGHLSARKPCPAPLKYTNSSQGQPSSTVAVARLGCETNLTIQGHFSRPCDLDRRSGLKIERAGPFGLNTTVTQSQRLPMSSNSRTIRLGQSTTQRTSTLSLQSPEFIPKTPVTTTSEPRPFEGESMSFSFAEHVPDLDQMKFEACMLETLNWQDNYACGLPRKATLADFMTL